MILDYLIHWQDYEGVSANYREGMRFALSLRDKKAGRYELGDIFAMVQEGVTRPVSEALFETHKKYIDVQIVVEGEEIVGWEDGNHLEEKVAYDETKDIAFEKGEGQNLLVKAGMFYIVFPHDAHRPCTHEQIPSIYKKIILKLPLE